MTTDSLLRRSIAADGRTVTLDPGFQGLPDTAHGGSVLALFDALSGATGPRAVASVYRRRVPLATPLALDRRPDGFALSDNGGVLVEGSVRAGRERPDARHVPPLGTSGVPLPLSKTCFVCGTTNAVGLRVQLSLDDTAVFGTWTAPEHLRASTPSALAIIAVTGLLDEAAFWLGAAASGEAGMTTELNVRLHRTPAFPSRLTIVGSRAAVRPRDDARYWDTDIAAWDDGGALVADASITFVAVRGAARKLVAGLLSMNAPEILRAVFPAYVQNI
jgi:hypothetical protein